MKQFTNVGDLAIDEIYYEKVDYIHDKDSYISVVATLKNKDKYFVQLDSVDLSLIDISVFYENSISYAPISSDTSKILLMRDFTEKFADSDMLHMYSYIPLKPDLNNVIKPENSISSVFVTRDKKYYITQINNDNLRINSVSVYKDFSKLLNEINETRYKFISVI